MQSLKIRGTIFIITCVLNKKMQLKEFANQLNKDARPLNVTDQYIISLSPKLYMQFGVIILTSGL